LPRLICFLRSRTFRGVDRFVAGWVDRGLQLAAVNGGLLHTTWGGSGNCASRARRPGDGPRSAGHPGSLSSKASVVLAPPVPGWYAFLARSTTGQAGGLCPHLRGNNVGELRAEANPRCSAPLPSAFVTCVPSSRCNRRWGLCPSSSADEKITRNYPTKDHCSGQRDRKTDV
jgi:hypothetical protein